MHISRFHAAVALMAGVSLAGAGCAAGPGPTGTRSDVTVTLTDYLIEASPTTVPAGEVRLAITNDGDTLHEVEVFTLPAGIDAAGLTVTSHVADTDSAGMEVIDEVEGIIPRGTPNLTVTLAPGRYALICNLPTHYALGMHATLTVE
ncbi:MAG TPA: hypothetical protein VJK49_05590 [Candidatus Limnocylindrales bacterium]|nr:hypothetical protein [Candidatus Limnocylindrales bacterium]